MGALDKKRDRSIDSLWRGNDVLIKAVEAAVGVPIGSDDGVLFIQDVGTKVAGRAYIDKNNGKLYRCTVGTSSTNNSGDFRVACIDANMTRMDRSVLYDKKLTSAGMPKVYDITGCSLSYGESAFYISYDHGTGLPSYLDFGIIGYATAFTIVPIVSTDAYVFNNGVFDYGTRFINQNRRLLVVKISNF